MMNEMVTGRNRWRGGLALLEEGAAMKSSASDKTHGILKIFQWLVHRERTRRQLKEVDQGVNPSRAFGSGARKR
ncbi:unnamed protein product [Closterium sp. Yama58-4]|nr:unnamed protein product [Closterium sp. Yama58-4]